MYDAMQQYFKGKFNLRQLRRGAAQCCKDTTCRSDGVTYSAKNTPGKIK